MLGLWYIAYAAGAIALSTMTHSIAIVCIYMLIGICIVCAIQKTKYIQAIVAITVLCISVQRIYIQRYQDAKQANIYMHTGIITDTIRHHRYTLQTISGDYILDTDKALSIGQEVYVQGYIYPHYAKPLTRYNPNAHQDIKQRLVFDYPKRLLMRGFIGRIYAKDVISLTNHQIGPIAQIRQHLRQRIDNLDIVPDHKGLLAGILIGDRSFFADHTYQMLIDAGLVHLIAVSGGNIVFVIIALGCILFWMPFYVRNACIIGSIILYAFICGGDSSVLRATIMGILSLMALFWGRQSYIRQSLGIARIIMLIYNPYMLMYDIGFVFSYAAVIGIVLVTQYFDTHIVPYLRKTTIEILKTVLLPSLGAIIGIFPFLLLFTDKINLVSIITNSIIAPWVGIYMIISIMTTYIDIHILQVSHTLITTGFYYVAQWTAQYGVYLVVDSMRFALLLCIGACIYSIVTVHNQHHKKIV